MSRQRQATEIEFPMSTPLRLVQNEWLAIALLGMLFGLYAFEFHAFSTQIDDAYISYRYAQNFVAGQGLVFNIGERVEGFTNLLWTLLIAAGIALGAKASQVGHWLGFCSGLFLLLATYAYSRCLLSKDTTALATLAPFLLYASNSFAFWTLSGLETPLFAAWGMCALIAYLFQRIDWVLIFCILASLTRPEGVLLAGLLLGVGWLVQIVVRRPDRLIGLMKLSSPCLLFAAFLAALTSWRIAYYGDFLPNTFYAKTGGLPFSFGPAYLYRFLIEGPSLLLLPLSFAVSCARFRMGLAYLALTIVYVVAIGGDVFAHGRFLLPVLPIMIAGALSGVARLYGTRRKTALAVAVSLPVYVLQSLYGSWPLNSDFPAKPEVARSLSISAKRDFAKKRGFSEGYQEQVVTRLRRLNPPVKLVASVGIGCLGYFGREFIILDLVGLVDRTIAHSSKVVDGAFILPGHQKTDADYVLSRRPDVIFIPKRGAAVALLPTTIDLQRNPRLERDYYWDTSINAYVRLPQRRQ